MACVHCSQAAEASRCLAASMEGQEAGISIKERHLSRQ